MDYKTVFKRYELKYMLTQKQKEKILKAMEPHMALDQYGRTTIRNIYFDTDTFRLARNPLKSRRIKKNYVFAVTPRLSLKARYL